jgi:hypothetical protein
MRVLWLADTLRRAGVTVVEHDGWQTRGWEPWEPQYGIVHATAAPRTQSDDRQVAIVRDGHSTLAGPIANACVDRAGTWHVLASGGCNTALTGWGGPANGLGNASLLGVEACNDNGLAQPPEEWPDVQYDALVLGWSAIAQQLGWSSDRIVGHKEHQPGDKSDPLFDMNTFRAAIQGGKPMGLKRFSGVTTGPLGTRIDEMVAKYYPKADELWITSAYRPTETGSHHAGLTYGGSPTAAVDFCGNAPGGFGPESQRRMRDFAKWCYDTFGDLLVELIHTTPYSDDSGFYVRNGVKYPGGGPFGSPTTRGTVANQHSDHVHLATSAALLDRIIARLEAAAPPPPPPPAPEPEPEPEPVPDVDLAKLAELLLKPLADVLLPAAVAAAERVAKDELAGSTYRLTKV